MMRATTFLLALWAGSCLGWNGQELGFALGTSMTDLTEMGTGEAALPEAAADQSPSEPPADEDADPDNPLIKRQTRYCPSGTHMCSNGRCCQNGYDCMAGGGCCPSGQKRCGNSKCYNPRTTTCCTGPGTVWGCDASSSCCRGGFCRRPSEQCCRNGSCDRDTTCCERECCRSVAYCGSDGRCKPCPPATRTVTSTTSRTTTRTRTVTTTANPAEDAPEFSCAPMTVTNAEGATLELGDDCALEYGPPSETTSSDLAARAVAPSPAPHCPLSSPTDAPPAELLPRQLPCTPFSTVTRTDWVTRTTTSTASITRTVNSGAEDEGFECPEMEVTNAVGDVLALDASCALAFTPAEPTDTQGDDDDSGSAPGKGFVLSVAGSVVGIWVGWLLL